MRARLCSMYDEVIRLAAEGAPQPLVQEVPLPAQAPQAMQHPPQRQEQGRTVLRVHGA
jgi:hypothetical protein